MRTTIPAILLTLSLIACGGERNAQRTPPAPPVPPAGETPPAATTGLPTSVVEIRMTGNGRDRSAFEPNQVTIAPGTTLRFINVSGGPHNIAFWSDSIPAAARSVLTSAMPRQMGPLNGPMLTGANETYDLSFPAGSPQGVYKGFCAPHLMQGMKLAVTVR